jgi:hypothetical protein
MYAAIRILPEYECSPIWVSKDGVTYSNLDLSYFEDTLKGGAFFNGTSNFKTLLIGLILQALVFVIRENIPYLN